MLEQAIGYIVLAVPLVLLAAAWHWRTQRGGSVQGWRSAVFVSGVSCASIAYVANIASWWYEGRAEALKAPFPSDDALLGIGTMMLVTSTVAVIASCCGKGYGRITASIAGLLVAVLWWALLMFGF